MRDNVVRRLRGICGAALACLAICTPAAMADRGAIVTVGEVNVEEPAQRAIIVHNGARELLILQTDVKADRETKVVEFMPLPSKPKVSLAPEGCFAALQEIIKAHNLRYIVQYRGLGRGDRDKAVKIVVEEQLGPHAVTVVKVKDAEEFVQWVGEFFRKNGLGEPALGPELRGIVAGYLKRGIRFFAFDIVTVSPEKKTVQPLAYEFECDRLYYPLVVTNLYSGTGTIELFTILPSGLDAGHRITIRPRVRKERRKWRFLRSTTATLEPEELAPLHPLLPNHLRIVENESAVLRAVRYEGRLEFDADLWLPIGYRGEHLACRTFLKALETGDIATLQVVVSVPFAFDRKEVIAGREELMVRLGELVNKTKGKRFEIRSIATDYVTDAHLPPLAEFDRRFVEEHLKAPVGGVSTVTFEDGKQLLLFHHTRPGLICRIVGFSD